MDKNLNMAIRIAEKTAEAGGRAYFVGGFVRDSLLGKITKDIDLEIHGIPVQTLEGILDSLGKRAAMGASFGVYSLKGYNLDISFPRKLGGAQRGKDAMAEDADPFVGTRNAAARRDLTINAMMQDVLTGEILDYFGGREDLQNGILRYITPESFGEDPLRVLRIAQFAAQFSFSVEEETLAFCQTLRLEGLARERIYVEVEKALMKSEKPSVFFETLRSMNQLHTWFPEVEALIGVEQELAFHPEGDVWNHTMLVIDEAAKLRDFAQHPACFMFAALCHDFGKVSTSEVIDGRIRSFGHEEAGIPLAKSFLGRMTSDGKLQKYVCNMILLHMRPNILAQQHSGRKAFSVIFDQSIEPGDLLLLAKADCLGNGNPPDYTEKETILREQLKLFYERMAQPYVKGEDLVKAGFRPGPDFGEALAFAHKLRLAGVTKDIALKQTIAMMKNNKIADS